MTQMYLVTLGLDQSHENCLERNAERTADALWDAYDRQQPAGLSDVGGVLGGSDQDRPRSEETEAPTKNPKAL